MLQSIGKKNNNSIMQKTKKSAGESTLHSLISKAQIQCKF